MEVLSIEYALLSMQCALLREVSPELRVVVVSVDHDKELLSISFYYDGVVSEKRIDDWDCVIAEGSTDLGPQLLLRCNIERLDYPQKIPLRGYLAYLRREPDALYYKNQLSHKVKIAEISMGYALLAVQYALLGVVTPELRAVVVDFNKEEFFLYVRFYYDGEVSKQLVDLWQSVIAEIGRDFCPNCILDGKVERVDSPQTVPFRGRFAYFRKEYDDTQRSNNLS